MPLQATAGAATYDAFGGGVTAANYIEDVFSTWLYTGNGSTQTITNGIDLAGKGGLVWIKSRTEGSTNYIGNNLLYGSAIGYERMYSNTTSAAGSGNVISVSSTGFTTEGLAASGYSGDSFTSWTFRKQPKFFDIVTWTGNNSSPRAISHNLGSAPGCMIVKRTDTSAAWYVYHRSSAASGYTPQECILSLDNTNAVTDNTTFWASTAPTSTVFTVGSSLNSSGATYVAYLFAHDAGGFGASGTDNVISCGSFTTDGSGNAQFMNLGWEPQWILFKRSSGVGNWNIIDNMRGMPVATSGSAGLAPNLSAAEDPVAFLTTLSATGNQFYPTTLASSSTYIYIAIRRGPMRTPTTGTSVFSPKGAISLTTGQVVTTGFVTDMSIAKFNGTQEWLLSDRLRNAVLYPDTTNSEGGLYGSAGPRPFDVQDGFKTSGISGSYFLWGFRRAPGFFDVVCYTGDSTTPRTITHNLGVAPELMLIKSRSNARGWAVHASAIGNNKYLILNGTNAALTDTTIWVNTAPTSSVFTVGDPFDVNNTGYTYVAYLFATVAGVSKVGSYTGTGTTLQVNCGFTAGSRFVLIKRTDSTGDWYVWDSARGIVAGNDPYLLLNSTAAEVTSTDYVDTYNAGFEISSTAPAAINANGGTFIFLAIA
jgi:hypothetical protein